MRRTISLFRASAAADAVGLSIDGPAAAIIEVRSVFGGGSGHDPDVRLLALGPAEHVAAHPAAASADVIDLPDAILIPGLVNAHTHLDLTHLGPHPFDPSQGFAGFADVVLKGRLYESAALCASVRRGVEALLRGGAVAVGDVAGAWQLDPVRELQRSPLMGVSFLEYFGQGRGQAGAIERLEEILHDLAPLRRHPRIAVGLQPHATYSVGRHVFAWSAAQRREQWPLSTHLAENMQEREFIARGGGPIRDLFERLNIWDDSNLEELAHDEHPIAHLRHALEAAPWLVAHVNDCDNAGLDILVRTGASVAYCPRSSEYFRNHEPFGPHRYRDMLAAGINVALGTDSVVNLPDECADRLSPLDEMRLLRRRDGTDARLLLRMATINGARALGLDPARFHFSIGAETKPISGLVAVRIRGDSDGGSPLERALTGRGSISMVVDPLGGIHRFEGA